MKSTTKSRAVVATLAIGAFAALFTTGANASVNLADISSTMISIDDGSTVIGRRGRGRDDGPNHASIELFKNFDVARRGRGRDDGANHASIQTFQGFEVARRGRGRDDGPNHG